MGQISRGDTLPHQMCPVLLYLQWQNDAPGAADPLLLFRIAYNAHHCHRECDDNRGDLQGRYESRGGRNLSLDILLIGLLAFQSDGR